ncbi:uncharacterized protein LOC134218349 [Armigeres subalbatus]|uniref:uncharacterized protein LOC134218349 n=1 Tax=Armigeres subalbatus TaxID=124917 RepID=UPI002ED3D283
MDLTHLSNEEIDYELALRFVVNLGPCTHRNKVLKLKDLMAQEGQLQEPACHSSQHVMSSTSNLEICQLRIGELRKRVDEAVQIKDTFAIAQLRSRLIHYKTRLEIIQPLAAFVSIKDTLCSLVKVLLDEVDCALVHYEKRTDRGESAVIVSIPPEEFGQKDNENLDSVQQKNSNEAYSLLGMDNILHQQGNASANLIDPGFAETAQEELPYEQRSFGNRRSTVEIPFSRVNGDKDNQHPHNTSIREEHEPHLSATSSPLAVGRGRGLTIRGLQDARSNISGRGRSTQSAETRQHGNEHIHNNNDLTFRNIISNNASLYADLVERLARRERRERAPRPERWEDRRMMKAVHNWPFKFRGEKDTTSLNIFLDRVETFAGSEGMNDETLLSSIKHLLLDDALDWYARAMSQRRLYSWQNFKNEIRREFLPSGYAQILRLEASFRFQGQSESFAKYYRDIAALFRFISPPMTEEEKFFIVKKI